MFSTHCEVEKSNPPKTVTPTGEIHRLEVESPGLPLIPRDNRATGGDKSAKKALQAAFEQEPTDIKMDRQREQDGAK